jgi:putative transferase (TIGR04331 family)
MKNYNILIKSLLLSNIPKFEKDNLAPRFIIPFMYESITSDDLLKYNLSYFEEEDGKPAHFISQYNYIGKIYDATLYNLAESLNLFHGKSLSIRQWEIIVGPWLRIYLESLYFRWKRLDWLLELGVKQIFVTNLDKINRAQISATRNSYVREKILNEDWNHIMLSNMAIFKFTKLKHIEFRTVDLKETNIIETPKINFIPLKKLIKTFAQRLLERISFRLSRNNIIIINNPYLSFLNKLRLSKLIKKRPVFYFNREFKSKSNISYRSRLFELINIGYNDEFHKFASSNLAKEIPVCYVEDLHRLESKAGELRLPSNPDIIYTGSGVESDEIIRFYIAKNIIKNSKYVISQHGGVYGTRLIPTKSEFYEHKIADTWISWGWKDSKNDNVKNGVNIKEIDRKTHKYSYADKILFTLPNITYISSRLMPLQPLKRIKDNKKIVKGLSDYVRKNLVIRSHPNHAKKSYVKEIADGCFISSQVSFQDDLSVAKLFITTNNSTTFLQSMTANCPSILILLGRQKFIRNESKKLFSLLEKNRILFYDINLAINHINLISRNPKKWWCAESVKEARSEFCKYHSYHSEESMNKLASLF